MKTGFDYFFGLQNMKIIVDKTVDLAIRKHFDSKSEDYNILKKQINELNEFQFICFCSDVFYHYPVGKWEIEYLGLMFLEVQYEKHTNPDFLPFLDEGEQEPNRVVKEWKVNLNVTNTLEDYENHIISSNEFSPEQSAIKLLEITETIVASFLQRISDVIDYFNRAVELVSNLDNNNDIIIRFKYYFFVLEELHHLKNKVEGLLDSIDLKIINLLSVSRKLNFNYNQKPLDYNYQLVYPLANTLNDWKELVMKKIIESNDEDSFIQVKEFFIECLSRYKLLTGQEYVNHKYIDDVNKQLDNKYLSNYSSVDSMIEWIETTFKAPGQIDVNEQFKFVEEVNSDYKIVINNSFSQRKFLEVFKTYFDFEGVKYDHDKLYSMVFHFTKMEKDSQGREAMISKRLRNPVSVQYIDFIPKGNIRDVINIFLLFKKAGMIKTGVSDLIKILLQIFKELKVSGTSESNIKKIWASSREDKKGVEYLDLKNTKFRTFLFENCPSVKKLFKKNTKNNFSFN